MEIERIKIGNFKKQKFVLRKVIKLTYLSLKGSNNVNEGKQIILVSIKVYLQLYYFIMIIQIVFSNY